MSGRFDAMRQRMSSIKISERVRSLYQPMILAAFVLAAGLLVRFIAVYRRSHHHDDEKYHREMRLAHWLIYIPLILLVPWVVYCSTQACRRRAA